MNQTVLIVEPNADGHRLFYVRLLVDAASERGLRPVVLTTGAALESSNWKVHLGDSAVEVRVPGSDLRSPKVVAAIAEEADAALVLVPDGDQFLMKTARSGGWRSPVRLRGLVMRSTAQPRRVAGQQLVLTLLKRTVLAALNTHRRLDVLHLLSALEASGREGEVVDPTVFVGDDDGARTVRQQLGVDENVHLFAVLGAIDPRKNVELVVRAATPLAGNATALLISGRWSSGTRDSITEAMQSARQAGLRVVIEDRLLDDKELDDRVLAADTIVVAHSNEGPSGLVAKAVAANSRVLASGAKSLRRDSFARPDLITWTPLDGPALTAAMLTERNRPSKQAESSGVLKKARATDGFVAPFLRGFPVG